MCSFINMFRFMKRLLKKFYSGIVVFLLSKVDIENVNIKTNVPQVPTTLLIWAEQLVLIRINTSLIHKT